VDLGIQNRNFLITGASRGIGRAIAESLLREGANVGLVAREQVQLENTVDDLRKQYGESRVIAWPTDCAKELSLLELRQQIARLWECLDGVIANVGDGRSAQDAIPDAEQWSKVWNTNFETALNTARVFLPLLQDSMGNLLFISSIAGLETIGAPVDYSTAKTAVIAFAKNLARKVAPEVRVNVIAPGNIHFSGSSWEDKIKTESERVEHMLQTAVPMKRFGTLEEVADVAAFLCSARASFMTGSIMVVDGGQTVSLL
jgi:3-oxoacyl-[acyl-carrier protein] reductase